MIILYNGHKAGLKKILSFLKHYEQVSGQKINFENNNIYVGKGGDESMVQTLTGFHPSALPFSYLGAPISVGKKKIMLFAPLIDKIRAKFSGWNVNNICEGGRLVIIKSVLASMYLLQVVNPPLAVFNLVEKIMARFFWDSGIDGENKIHWSKWSMICKPTDEGGIGVRRLQDDSKAFGIKLWYRFRLNDSLWAKCLLLKYSSNKFPGFIISKPQDSSVWKRMLLTKKVGT